MRHLLSRAAGFVPATVRTALRNGVFFILDAIDKADRQKAMIPPRSLIFVGNGDYRKTGQEFKKYFINLGGLRQDEKVLDVGCGIGRMAVPLTEYLSAQGEYCGLDIVKKGITWCQENITPKFKQFRFFHADVLNKSYNPTGQWVAADLRFPFDNEYFDFVFLTSVFTHMLPKDLENYLTEIARVLKPGGRSLITYFLLNSESERILATGKSQMDFRSSGEGYWTTDMENPEDAVAYSEKFIRNLYDRLGMIIQTPVRYGSWCNREQHLSFQDIVIATKKNKAD